MEIPNWTFEAFGYLFWGILFSASCLSLACLFSAIGFWRRASKSAKDAGALADHALRDLAADRPVSGGLDAVVDYLKEPGAEHAGIQAIVSLHVCRLERGAIRVCAFLAKCAPLAGLAGTLVGVAQALSHFSQQPDNPQPVIQGFATALGTTLAGIAVSFVSLGAKAVWENVLIKTMGVLLEASLIVKARLNRPANEDTEAPAIIHRTRSVQRPIRRPCRRPTKRKTKK